VKISVDIFYRVREGIQKGTFVFLILLLSSCASKKPYVMESLPEGGTKGVASWYGRDFHGRPTASGEIFNMYDYTCAHREYPFGTKLRVTNLNNKKEVICTVNDRGPFVAGRDLDLSYGAAKQIDLIGPGVAEVFMEPIGRDYQYVKYVSYKPIPGQLTIQVGAFKEVENALRLKDALSLSYRNVYINKAVIKGETFFRVRVGKFNSYEEAYNMAKLMGQEGYKILITSFEGGLKDEI